MKHSTKKVKKRLLLFVLIIAAAISIPLVAASVSYGAEGHQKIITNLNELKDYTNYNADVSLEERSDFIYFGTLDNKPIKWIVLSKNGSGATSYNGAEANQVMFLMSYEILGSSIVHGYWDPNANGWNSGKAKDLNSKWDISKTKEWCTNLATGSAFTSAEKTAITETTKATSNNSISDALNSEKIFLLSKDEVNTYLVDEKSRTLKYYWWLRTAHQNLTSNCLCVGSDGKIWGIETWLSYNCRPGMNVGKDYIILLSKAGENKGTSVGSLAPVGTFEGNEWKVTLLDPDEHDKFTASYDSQSGSAVTVNYSNAVKGENEYISAIIRDEDSEKVKYYGKLKVVSNDADCRGNVEIKLPKGFESGDALYVFQENETDAASTCYSSSLKKIEGTTPISECIGFVDGNDFVDQNISLIGDMGDALEAEICNIPSGAAITATTDKNDIVSCKVEDGKLKINCLMDGTVKITVSVNSTILTANITVNKIYSNKKDVTVEKGKSTTVTDETGNYKNSYNGKLLDSETATVTVNDINIQAVPAVSSKLTKLTEVKSGKYIVGSNSGKYLTVSDNKVGTTKDPEKAAEWELSGSSDDAVLKCGNYYLNHSTSGVSLSTSNSDASWKYSSSKGFYFTKSSKRWFWTTTSTYYLTGSAGISTSSSNLAAAYTYTPGTPAVSGKTATEITFTGVALGTTKVLVGSTLYNITVTEPSVEPVTQTITVSIKDDEYKLLKSYTISGKAGTSYTITPEDIYGYSKPEQITGAFENSETGEIVLIYQLNTNKTSLKTAIDNAKNVKVEDYTTETYNAYNDAVKAGTTVYDKPRATQTEVDNALAAINTAYGNLKAKTVTPASGYVLDSDGIDSGSEYIIVSGNKAIADNNGSIKSVSVTVSGNNIAAVDDSCIWILTKSGSSTTIKNKKTGRYLVCSISGSFFSKKGSISLSTSSSTWNTSQNGSNISFYVSSWFSSFYLNGNFGVSKNSSSNLTIYKKS